MESGALEFFKALLKAPSPSGYERPAQDVVRDYVASFADEVTTDLHGNVIVAKNPGTPLKVMLAGHADQIGLLVQHIDDKGFISVQPIGGWDPQQLIGQRLIIWADKGPVLGVIARKPIHLLNDEERKAVVKLENLWIDIGVSSKEDASKLVRVGDPVTFELGMHELQGQLVCGPQMDNKTGLWVVIEAMRRASKHKLRTSLYSVSTVAEEIGLRGAKTSAYGIDPQIGIAVDVTHATDCPTIDKKQEGDVDLGGGPVVYRGPNMNPVVFDRLEKVANEKDIPFQIGALSRASPTDANALQVSRAGVAAGLISIPNRYMHSSVEVISLEDLDKAAELLAEFVVDLDPSDDFTP